MKRLFSYIENNKPEYPGNLNMKEQSQEYAEARNYIREMLQAALLEVVMDHIKGNKTPYFQYNQDFDAYVIYSLFDFFL